MTIALHVHNVQTMFNRWKKIWVYHACQFATLEWTARCGDRYDTQPMESYIQCESKKSPRGVVIFFIFSQTVENFNRFFTRLLYAPIYARLQIFIQLTPSLTKLCHIKRDYAVHIIGPMLKMSTIGRNACVDTFA